MIEYILRGHTKEGKIVMQMAVNDDIDEVREIKHRLIKENPKLTFIISDLNGKTYL